MTLEGQTRRAWRCPIQLAVLTMIGLISALLGTGVWRWLAWLCLGVPIAAALRPLLLRPRSSQGARRIPRARTGATRD